MDVPINCVWIVDAGVHTADADLSAMSTLIDVVHRRLLLLKGKREKPLLVTRAYAVTQMRTQERIHSVNHLGIKQSLKSRQLKRIHFKDT